MASTQILVVEDRDSLRKLMLHTLRQEGFSVETAADGEEAIRLLGGRRFDLVFTDLKLPGVSGIDVVKASRQHQPHAPVIVMTAFGTVQTAVEAMKLGASDFLEKPIEIDDLIAMARSRLRAEDEEFFQPPGGPMIVGRHPRMRAALRLLEKVAQTDSTVLITGESGTGKELFAQALHALSPRAKGPMVAVNCAAIPASLMENELFGHEKGAFTGANRRQAGRFELADRGTLFLDEIGELEIGVQGKVLRVLEERIFERVGGGRPTRVDIRLVAATNRDLESMVAAGTFRSDLFFRLDVFPIELPALRERATDIPLLAAHLGQQIAQRLGRGPFDFEPAALDWLADQDWPGNVRQMANVLERALILHEGYHLGVAALEPHLRGQRQRDDRESVRLALVESDGDKRRAAEILGVSLRTLQRKVQQYDLEGVPRYRS